MAAPSALVLKCESCGAEAPHRVLRGKIGGKDEIVFEGTVKCPNCGRVSTVVTREPTPIEIPLIVSWLDKSERPSLEFSPEENVTVGEALDLGDSRIEVTAVAPKGRRVAAAIRAEVLARRPKVVALELEPARYQAIMSREPRRRGWSILGLLAQFQVRIADQYGVQVGDEMVAAARAAQEIGSEIVLIDEDSRGVLRRVWAEMSFRERVRLLASALGALFTRKERVEAELQRFYQDEQSFLREFATELPTAKRILIDERDAVMGRTLRQLEESRGGIVAVVGEGHVDGLVRHLAGVPVQVVHLEQLRAAPAGPNASVNVSVHL